MKKRKLLWILAIIVLIVTFVLTLIGLFFNKNVNEKRNGLSGEFDVSSKGMIAYVHYTDGKPEFHLYDLEKSTETKLFELDVDKMIVDPTFSNDGETLTFIEMNKDLEDELQSVVYQVDLDSMQVNELFSAQAVVTEIEFSQTDESLLYLKAEVFQNYSPIASKRPHDFDLFEYHVQKDEHLQHTNFKQYAMNSLTVAQDGESIFVQMLDEDEVETAEESFDMKMRVFNISLDGDKPVAISPKLDVDIYDFTIEPNEDFMIYQAVSNPFSGETFQYELYKYDFETKEVQQLTELQEYAGHPVISRHMNKIFFIVDKRFGKKDADYHLYEMKLDGTEVTEIILPINAGIDAK